MSEKSAPKGQYTDEFEFEAIRLAESVGQYEAARRLGVPVATLGKGASVAVVSMTLANRVVLKRSLHERLARSVNRARFRVFRTERILPATRSPAQRQSASQRDPGR
ncbi:hypothetical protein DM82_5864 [Burkholderia oklahomensis]|uniref:Uncharacterized protein n=1 Tax=Burkholderia oklahomensis TaxID=342113 RepID=A0AAI8BC36_9BURK|nr:hypothetical protein DM82_5864 [Burkholderia oklahomensis]